MVQKPKRQRKSDPSDASSGDEIEVDEEASQVQAGKGADGGEEVEDGNEAQLESMVRNAILHRTNIKGVRISRWYTYRLAGSLMLLV